ncbi:uncharacterized protein RJT21DRAFT_127029 [Scheffersomyces amazonensis]|uniref:uncharacterized protein n=1 Tax=Scheffersomyces amazonensis TaxID=1078765 RepID=UPI00315CCD4B
MKLSLIPLFGIFCSVISLVQAVSYDAAFNKELIHYNHYQFDNDKYEIIDANNVIGFNGLNQFVSIATDGNVNWIIEDINQFNQFKVVGTYIYLYSDISSSITILELNSGVLVKTIRANSSKFDIINFFDTGALLLNQDGTLLYIDDDKQEVIDQLSLKNSIGSTHYEQLNGFAYLIIDRNYLIKLDSNKSILNKVRLNLANIKEFKDLTIIDDLGNISIVSDIDNEIIVKNIELSIGGLHIINAKYYYNIEGNNKLVLYTLKNDQFEKVWEKSIINTEIDDVKAISYGLSDYLIISKSNGSKEVLDLTDFLDLDDTSSIKEIKIKVSDIPNRIDIITSFENVIQLVSVNNNLDGNIYDLQDGSQIKSFKNSESQLLINNDIYLIIDKPASKNAINEVNNLLHEESTLLLKNWIKRAIRHLSQLGRYVTSFITSSHTDVLSEIEDDTGLTKYVLLYDNGSKSIIAINSSTGKFEWKASVSEAPKKFLQVNDNIIALFSTSIIEIDPLDGSLVSRTPVEDAVSITLARGNAKKDTFIIEKSNSFEAISPIAQDAFAFKSNSEKVQGHKLVHGGSKSSIQTWTFQPKGEKILDAISKDWNSVTASIGTPLADKSILYKYLNPNVIAILTETDQKQLKLYLIDGILGTVLEIFEHTINEVIDFSSINLIIDDNWVIYSYFVKAPKLEQRINVIDLYDTDKSIKNGPQVIISSHEQNSTINSFTEKSFIFPERIINLSSSKSSNGITVKSITALTESGYLIEIPKYILNSRRIEDRQLNQEDYLNDFKPLAYDPVISISTYSVLNHKHKLITNKNIKGEILIVPTHYESTSVICYINKYNYFCSLIQPSSSFDTLGSGFETVKLLLTMAALLAVYIITKPLVSNKKLNDQWLHS